MLNRHPCCQEQWRPSIFILLNKYQVSWPQCQRCWQKTWAFFRVREKGLNHSEDISRTRFWFMQAAFASQVPPGRWQMKNPSLENQNLMRGKRNPARPLIQAWSIVVCCVLPSAQIGLLFWQEILSLHCLICKASWKIVCSRLLD